MHRVYGRCWRAALLSELFLQHYQHFARRRERMRQIQCPEGTCGKAFCTSWAN